MSTGFSKWTNNNNSDLNIRAVRFGFKKPILETELNELQDLVFQSISNTNRVNNKPDTYTSNAGSSLTWEYSQGSDTTIANLILNATSLTDVIKCVFSGGLEYFIKPTHVGRQVLTSVVMAKGATTGTNITLVAKAQLKTLSPDSSDSEYSSRVDYAIDSRYPSLVSTKRVAVESGFDGVYTSALLEDYTSVYDRLSNTVIPSLNSDTESYIILGSWRKTDSGWETVHELQKSVIGMTEAKYQMASDAINTFGTFSLTPIPDGTNVEIRIDLPLKSTKFGYYSIVNDGVTVGQAVPITQPIVVDGSLVMSTTEIYLFDLREISSSSMWGSFSGQSWEDLLNQKWFDADMKTPSLSLKFNEVSTLKGVTFGSLTINK